VAQCSWANQPWQELAIDDSALPRLFEEGARRLPFLHDLFDLACNKQDSRDIVVFSNSDLCMAPDACVRIVAALQSNDAGYAFRKDVYYRLNRPPSIEEIHQGVDYAGADLFFFRVGWWSKFRKFLPDMLLAREAWDCVMRHLIEETNPNKPLALENICLHERHNNGWENPNIRYMLKGQIHNLHLAKAFLKQRGINPGNFGIR
jgi:hypothetical protein